jgi:glycosyltransferase involved in cell wall biosynthesis
MVTRVGAEGSQVSPAAAPALCVSVLLPVFNAMPWLPLAVLSCLRQRGVRVELIAVDDGCTDGSREFLLEVAGLLRGGAAGASKRPRALDDGERAALEAQRRKLNPAFHLATRELSESNAAALHIAGSSAGHAAAVDKARAAAAARQTKAEPPGVASASTEQADAAATTEATQAKTAARARAPTSPSASSSSITAAATTSGSIMAVALSAAEVVERCRGYDCSLVVQHTGGRGQGAALNMAYQCASHDLIGEMEADDECPEDRFERLCAALEQHPEWDCVASETALIGADRQGMVRYVDWQNGLQTPEEMERGRFIELPALRQTALYRRAALVRLLVPDAVTLEAEPEQRLRQRQEDQHQDQHQQDQLQQQHSDAVLGARPLVVYRDLREWPVDSDFWLRWFDAGLVAGKVAAPALYLWRQHAGQHTRVQGRCSLANLRRCKAHFLVSPLRGPCARGRKVQVWSTGATLHAWADELRRAGCADVEAVEYRPGQPAPKLWRARRPSDVPPVVRLLAFGMESARRKARAALKDWDPDLDWFVA